MYLVFVKETIYTMKAQMEYNKKKVRKIRKRWKSKEIKQNPYARLFMNLKKHKLCSRKNLIKEKINKESERMFVPFLIKQI